jgi:hypothetical protein
VSKITALVVGLNNRHRHQIVRQVEKYGVDVVHINGDRRPIDKYPLCDIAVLTICGCSHGAVEDVLSLYRKNDRPYLTTHDSFSPIKDRFELFVRTHKENHDMITEILKLKHLVYSNFKVGDEFTRKDLVDLVRKTYATSDGSLGINIDAVSQAVRRNPDPVFDFKDVMFQHKKSGALFVLNKSPQSGKTYVLRRVDTKDLLRFQEENMSLDAIHRLHGKIVSETLGETVPLFVATDDIVVKPVAPVQAKQEFKTEMSPVLSDVKTAVGLLLEQIQNVEKMAAKGGTEEDVELAKKAREWTQAVPFLSTATQAQLAKLSAICQVMFS